MDSKYLCPATRWLYKVSLLKYLWKASQSTFKDTYKLTNSFDHTAASGDMQTYQIRTTPSATSLPQTVVMTSPVTLTSQTTKTDDPQLKREIRLMKNR